MLVANCRVRASVEHQTQEGFAGLQHIFGNAVGRPFVYVALSVDEANRRVKGRVKIESVAWVAFEIGLIKEDIDYLV